MIKSRRFKLHLPASIAIALLIFVLAWAFQFLHPPLTVDIGASDAIDNLYLDEGSHLDSDTKQDRGYGGFYAPEAQIVPNSVSDRTFRWSESTAYLKIHWPLASVPLTATLRISAPRPDRPPDQPGTNLTITSVMERDETVLVKDLPIYGLPRDYNFQIPAHLTPNLAEIKLRIQADSDFKPGKGDTRNLSVIFFNISFEPDYASLSWRTWIASLEQPGLLAIMTFFGGAIGQLFFKKRRWILLSEATSGFLLLISLLFWPLQAAPYYAAWSLAIPLAWLLFWLADLFVKGTPNLPAPFVYAATIYPILPITQFALGHLNLYTVNTGSVTFAIYIGALFFCAGMYIRFYLLGPKQVTAFEQSFVRAMVIAAAVSFFYNHFYVWQVNLYRGSDFKVYYYAMLNFESGKPLYDLGSVVNHSGDAARMPPTFGLLMWPFVRIFTYNAEFALFVWRILNELMIIPIILLLIRIFGGIRNSKNFTPSVLFLCLSFNQISETIAYGQFNILLLLVLGITALFVKQKRDSLSGAILSVAATIKLIPLTWIVFWPVEKRWKGIIGLVGGSVAVMFLTTLAVGWDTVYTYVTRIVFAVNRPEIGISNQSMFGFLGRLSVAKVMDDYKGNLASWVSWVGYGGALILTLFTIFSIWRKRGISAEYDLLKLSSLNLLMLIIPPFIWFHYVTLGLISVLTLLVVLSQQETDKGVPRWQLILFGLAFTTVAYGGRSDFFFTEAVGLARIGSSYRFYAVVILWLLNLYFLWQSKPVSINKAIISTEITSPSPV